MEHLKLINLAVFTNRETWEIGIIKIAKSLDLKCLSLSQNYELISRLSLEIRIFEKSNCPRNIFVWESELTQTPKKNIK